MKFRNSSPLVLFGLCSSVFAAGTPTSSSKPPTVTDCKQGVTYHGTERNGVEMFLGIPFGEDTGGQNRFKPPRPYVPKHGSVVKADAFGPQCPQAKDDSIPGFEVPNSEDCLNLNIARPKGTKPKANLPVMVWIYGGSYWTGSNAMPLYWPDGLVLESQANGLPVMHVAMNYRLGVFGFATSDALHSEGSLNAGLRDQRLALEWVRDNIARFGGDPDKVTIFGQSSGGLSVGLQIMAYGGSKPAPFKQSICESQALEPALTSNLTVNSMTDVANKLGCGKNGVNAADTITCLRKLDMNVVLNGSIAAFNESANVGDIWLPTVDGDFLPDKPPKLISEGRFADVTAAIGWTQDDLTLFTDPDIKTAKDTRAYLHNYAPDVSNSNLDKLISLYPASEFAANESANKSAEFYRAARITRDIYMLCPPVFYAEHISAKGNDVYLYDWNQTVMNDFWASEGQTGLGVTHLAELPYVLGALEGFNASGFPIHAGPEDYALMDRGSRSWSTFAHKGKFSLDGHDTFKGWDKAFAKKGNMGIFVAGGPNEGLSYTDGPGAHPAIKEQKLRQRCGFINSPEMLEQLKI